MRHHTVRSAGSILLFALIALIAVVQAAATGSDPGLARALAAQQALVHDHTTDAVAYNDLGNLLLLAERSGEAEAAYMRAIEIDGQQTTARFNLAVLLMQRGEDKEAVEHLESVLGVEPEHAWANYQLGILLAARGDRSRAIDLYARAFAADQSLTFAENNPHIIDNKLTTQALLHAQRYIEGGTAVQVPRQYGDGMRIKALMLGVGEDDPIESQQAVDPRGDESPAVPADTMRTDDEDASGLSRDADHRVEREELSQLVDAAETSRVLSSDDLDASDRTGEATGGGAAPPRGPGSVFNRYRPPRATASAQRAGRQRSPSNAPSARTPTRRTPSIGGVAVPTSPSAGSADRQGEAERTRSQRFRPSVRSSAQLDLSLEPLPERTGL